MPADRPAPIPVTLQNGDIHVDGEVLPLQGLTVRNQLGKGANAVVFQAFDEALHRDVAIKVWTRAFSKPQLERARNEALKLARFSHPLILTVHSFTSHHRTAYAVLELIRGKTAGEWLTSSPSLAHRCDVWAMLSAALHHAYRYGVLHGDPHTGNILVFDDESGFHQSIVPERLRSSEHSLGIKLADFGSSLLWPSHDDFERRESRVLLETANRLFPDVSPDSLLDISEHEDPAVILAALDRLRQYVLASTLKLEPSGKLSERSAGERVALIGDAITEAPFFRLDRVLQDLRTRRVVFEKHVFRRISMTLNFDHDGVYDAPFDAYETEILEGLQEIYGRANSREQFRKRNSFITGTPVASEDQR